MNPETKILIRVAVPIVSIILAIIRLLIVLPAVNSTINTSKSLIESQDVAKGSKVMVLLGSGGHTGEMVRILTHVNMSDFSRTWVVSSGDTTSLEKAKDFESNLVSDYKPHFLSLRRARSVGQPWLLSVKTTLQSLASTVEALRNHEIPNVLLLNGPGTSVPLAYILFVLKYLGLAKTRIVYIESFARVDSLSLSGLLIMPIADRFIVQWEQLYLKYHRAEYYGALI